MRSTSLPVLVLAAVMVSSRAPTSSPQFLARVDAVSVDVSVVDRQGRLVRNLTAADFTVMEDGKPQPIEYFRFVELPQVPTVTAAWQREVAPDVARNEDVTERRLVVIVMDDAMIPFDGQMISSAKRIARDVVERLGPADLAAVVFTYDGRPAQNFTHDRARLLAAIDRFTSGGYEPTYDSHKKPSPAFSAALGALLRTVDTLGAVPERRKAIVYVSTGVPVLVDNPDLSLTGQSQLSWLMRQTVTRAQRNNVNIYSVDPGGLDGMRAYMSNRNQRTEAFILEGIEESSRAYLEFLRGLSETTGGRAFTNTNEFTSRIDQMFRDTGAFYLLGYQAPNPREDGRFRRLQVRVNRTGVTVTTRRGYYARQPSNATPREYSATDIAIAGLLPNPGRPLALAAAPFEGSGQAGSAVALILSLSPREGSALRDPEPVDVLFSAFSISGDPRGTMRLTARTAVGASGNNVFEVFGRLDLTPGRYELRASATTTGTSGSVYSYVDVPDFAAAPLTLSGVVLTVDPPVDAGPRALFQAFLPVVPTASRSFAPSDRVTSFVRVYQHPRQTPAPVTLSTQVIDAADSLVWDTAHVIDTGSFSAGHAADFRADLPMDRLRPGSYLLRVEARAGEHTARRDVIISVK